MRKAMLVVVATGALLVGCDGGGTRQSGTSPASTAAETPRPSAAASRPGGSKPPTISPEESKAIANDTQNYTFEQKVEIGAVVPLHCQDTKKTWADIAYPGGEATSSGYKISRSAYPHDEDVILGMFTDINKTGCTFSYLVASKRVSPQGPALLARPDRQHWNVETPRVDLAEGGFVSYRVRIDYGRTTYLLFKANSDTAASKPVVLTHYKGGAYTAIQESPEELLK